MSNLQHPPHTLPFKPPLFYMELKQQLQHKNYYFFQPKLGEKTGNGPGRSQLDFCSGPDKDVEPEFSLTFITTAKMSFFIQPLIRFLTSS